MPIGEGWDVPAEEVPWSDFHWFRVSPRGVLVVVALSESPLWYTGHYVDGRMAPCTGKACSLCGEGIGGQIRYIFGVAEVSTHRAGVIELGRQNGLLVRSWIPKRGEFRGMVLELSKHSQARTSRTEVVYVDREEPPWYLALEAPDVRRALLLTWKKAGFAIPEGM